MSATYPFARPQTAVDVLLFTVQDFWDRPGERPRLEIALITRDREPFDGKLALPGTVLRIEPDETSGAVDHTDLDAARRVLKDKLGIRAPHLEQLYTWFTRDVDPRGATTVIAYFAVVPFDHFRDAPPERVQFMPVDALPRLAFNHNEIIKSGVERVRGKASYSSLPALLMPKCFTFKELQLMYEAVLGRPFDQTNFGRRVMELDIIEAIDPASDAAKTTMARTVTRGQAGRRPQVWRLKQKKLVTFEKTMF
jgi:8-oxo-dGTP diphosphatase